MTEQYFHYFRTTDYRGILAPNIMSRVRFSEALLADVVSYHPYLISDDDRPDTVAWHYYGDANYDWLVLLANDLVDVVSQWPMTQPQFDAHMKDKYTTLALAHNTIDHYELLTADTTIAESAWEALDANMQRYYEIDPRSRSVTLFRPRADKLALSPAAWATLDTDEKLMWQSISCYQSEFNINEAKRAIRLVDRAYAPILARQLRRLLEQAGD